MASRGNSWKLLCCGMGHRKQEDNDQYNNHAPHESGPEQSINPFPVFPPLPPEELLRDREYHYKSIQDRQFAAPEGEMKDKPLYALYRLYEWIVLDSNIGMRNELELFWWTRCPVANIPDPGEQNEPARYAILSCIPALLVESFNQRIDMGLRREEPHSIMSQEEAKKWAATPKHYETVPEWTRQVAPLDKTLHIPHTMLEEPQLDSLDNPQASKPFKEKNILLWHPHIHFM